jgi:hypothetical protein
MTFDEFRAKVATEPDRTSERDVHVPSAELLADVRNGRATRLTDFVADPRSRVERRTSTTGHRFGPGLPIAAIADWLDRWPHQPLPADLGELLGRMNGIHLWADLETGRSYEGLAPLEEWDLARVKMWGPETGQALLPDRYLALSYHADSAAFVVLNVETGTYYLMDSAGPDESCPVGARAGDILDWFWDHRGLP